MRFTCEREKLAAALVNIEGFFLPSKARRLSGLVMNVSDGCLSLSCCAPAAATAIELSLPLDGVYVAGQVVVPLDLLADVVSVFPAEVMTVSTDEGSSKAEVRGERMVTSLVCLAEAEEIRFKEPEGWVTVQAGDLAAAYREVSFATDTSSHAVLSGIYIRLDQGQLTFAAANGFLLSQRRIQAANGNGKAVDTVCPPRFLGWLARAASRGGQETLALTLSRESIQAKVLLRVAECRVCTPSVEGKFPGYSKYLELESKLTATVDLERLAGALKVVLAVSRDDANKVRLSFGEGM
jgi:DNA polymerase-3 subunit beta